MQTSACVFAEDIPLYSIGKFRLVSIPWPALSPSFRNTFIVSHFPSRKCELQLPLYSNAIACSLFVLHQFTCYAVTAPPSLPTSQCFSGEDSLAQHSHLHNPPLYCVARDRRDLQITSISEPPNTDSPTLPVISLPQPVCKPACKWAHHISSRTSRAGLRASRPAVSPFLGTSHERNLMHSLR